jgi:hypothetical protein
MANIKLIYFDSVGINSDTFQAKLQNVCQSIFVIRDGLILVNFTGTSKDLYDLAITNNEKNVFICNIETSPYSYWGYMSKDLWDWIKKNNEK